MNIILWIIATVLCAYASYWMGRLKGFQEGRESWAGVVIEKNRLIETLKSAVKLRDDILLDNDRERFTRSLESRYMGVEEKK